MIAIELQQEGSDTCCIIPDVKELLSADPFSLAHYITNVITMYIPTSLSDSCKPSCPITFVPLYHKVTHQSLTIV